MEANGLRIGNYITMGDDITTVKIIYLESITGDNDLTAPMYSTIMPIKPIPLTEELLLKCGFEFNGNSWQGEFDGGCREWQFVNGVFDSYQDYGDNSFFWNKKAEIKYLHQLQNFIFIKTGEELTIKM